MSAWSERVDLLRFVGDSFAFKPTDVAVGAGQLVAVSEFPDAFNNSRYRFADGYHVGLQVDVDTHQSRLLRFTWPRGNFAHPRAGIARDGTVHVLWHETAGVSIDDSTGGRGTPQLWTGIVREHEIVEPRLLLWGPDLNRPSRIIPDERGNLHAVVAQWVSSAGPLLMHLTMGRGATRIDTIPQARIPARMSPDLRIVGDTLHLVYIAADEMWEGPVRRDYSSVWYMRSNDLGRSWLPRVRVQLSGMRPAFAPLLNVTTSGTLVVAWREEAYDEPARPHAITGARSTDGIRWSRLPAVSRLEAPRDVSSLWSDRCGRVFLHVQDGALGESLRSYTVALHDSTWGTPQLHETPNKGIVRSFIVHDDAGTLFRLFPSVIWVPGTLAEVYLHLTNQRPVLPD